MTYVAMFPDYREQNPYQRELARELAILGIDAGFPFGYRRGFHFSRTLKSPEWKKTQVLHLHWPDFYLRGNGPLARKWYAAKLRFDLTYALRGRKLAWTVHNVSSHDSHQDPVELSFSRWLAKRASILFVHDEELVGQVARHFSTSMEKIVVIPHGHYRSVYGEPPSKNDARKSLGIPSDKRTALFLGMLRPYKGLDDLLDIWPRILSQVPNAQLILAGAGEDTEYIEHIQRRCHNMPGVRLEARFITNEEIPVFYAAADLALLPFRAITTSGSLILALSYECPVVTPAIPSITGTLEFQASLLYEPGKKDALYHATLTGLQADTNKWKPHLKELRHHYSWKRAAELTKKGYVYHPRC